MMMFDDNYNVDVYKMTNSLNNYKPTFFGMSIDSPSMLKLFNDKICDIKLVTPYPTPIKIIKNENATIVFWNDKTKTVVTKEEGKEDNIYDAFCFAFAKKMFGSTSKVVDTVDKVNYDAIKEAERLKRNAEAKKAREIREAKARKKFKKDVRREEYRRRVEKEADERAARKEEG